MQQRVKSAISWGVWRAAPINQTLSKAIIKLAPEDLEFTEIPIGDLPLFSYDYDADFPPEGRALKEAIEGSDGILFVSPGSIGTAVMQSSMRAVPSFLDAQQLNAPEAYMKFNPDAFGSDGEVKEESTEAFLRHCMEEYGAFVERVLAANAPGHIGDPEPDTQKLSR